MSVARYPAVPAARPGGGAVAILTLSVALVHLAMAGFIPVFQDEAYYALWATRLAPAYYDHPPMIALWIRAGEALLGDSPAGIRLVSVLGFAAVTPLCWDMARRLGAGPRRAFAAALFFNIMALPAALGFTATPDSPSTFFWALTLWLVLVAVGTGTDEAGNSPKSNANRRVWALAGLAAGLGVLSKFTNLFLGVGLLFWLLASREGRRRLATPGPWIMAAVTLATLAPFLGWNALHDWYAFHRQFGRLGPAPSEGSHVGDYIAATLVSATPLLILPILRAGWRLRGAAALLAATATPFLLFLLVHALHAKVQANWIVPLSPGLAVMAALGLRRANGARIAIPALAGAGVAVLGLTLAFWPGRPVFRGDNPANQTKGWVPLSQKLEAKAAETGARWIATTDYGTTGALALRLPDLPVWQITETERYLFRGPFPHALCDAKGLLVQPEPVEQGQWASALFHDVGAQVALARSSSGAPLRQYRVTEVSGLGTCH